MKKLLLFSMMCLLALSMQAQCPTNDQTYLDLGLPSGTRWRTYNATGYYSYDDAIRQFGKRLPSREQWEELIAECQWTWTGAGYKVTGPNGNVIELPAKGLISRNEIIGSSSSGLYLSSTIKEMEQYQNGAVPRIFYLEFDKTNIRMLDRTDGDGLSVRLVCGSN